MLVVADDLLPNEAEPGRAAGLRAWAVGEGLRANGIPVRFAVRTTWWPATRPVPAARAFETYWESPTDLEGAVRELDPDVVVNCSYPSLLPRNAAERLLVQDVNGPRILEGAFRDPARFQSAALREMFAYSAADYFVCGGDRQLCFYYPWLALSGFDISDPSRCRVVRLGLTGDPPVREASAARLLSAASALPWTDPRWGWRITADEAARLGGRMRVLFSDDGTASSAAFLREEVSRLRGAAGCEVGPAVGWEEFKREMATAVAAVDVMERNSEREMAVPTRTLGYLWAGLPPILADFGDLSELVTRFDAGWVVAAHDERALRQAVREALGEAAIAVRKSANARRLHETVLRPEVATVGLAAICRDGTPRPGKRVAPPTGLRQRLGRGILRAAHVLAGSPRVGWAS